MYFSLYRWHTVCTLLLFSSNHERYLLIQVTGSIYHSLSVFPPIGIFIMSFFFASANCTAEIVLFHVSVIAWRFLYTCMIPSLVCSVWINETGVLNSFTVMVALTVSPCSSIRFSFLIYFDVLLHDDLHFPNFFP